MASNHTENLKLSQWLATDPVLRSDFNSDNQKIEEAMRYMPQFMVGSYVGNGEYGKDHPKRLSFAFRPLLLIVVADDGGTLYPGTIFLAGQENSSGMGHTDSSIYALQLHVTWEDNAVSWYTDRTSADPQLTKSDTVYHFFAFGLTT